MNIEMKFSPKAILLGKLNYYMLANVAESCDSLDRSRSVALNLYNSKVSLRQSQFLEAPYTDFDFSSYSSVENNEKRVLLYNSLLYYKESNNKKKT